jgi:hypothetical protein
LVRRSLLLIRLVGFGPLSATHLLDLAGERIASTFGRRTPSPTECPQASGRTLPQLVKPLFGRH